MIPDLNFKVANFSREDLAKPFKLGDLDEAIKVFENYSGVSIELDTDLECPNRGLDVRVTGPNTSVRSCGGGGLKLDLALRVVLLGMINYHRVALEGEKRKVYWDMRNQLRTLTLDYSEEAIEFRRKQSVRGLPQLKWWIPLDEQ